MSETTHDTHWHGVIDIGSNSVRLVIYDVSGHALLPHYNEKVMAGLGAGLAESGRLSVTGIEIAMKALGRYRAILQGLNVKRLRVVATAAVRLAEDGSDFVKRVERETGLEVSVLSGAEEARLSALGVASGLHKASGLVGDLGGSSLEFSRIEDGQVMDGETHLLGPLSIDPENMSEEDLRAAIRGALDASKLLRTTEGRFYMVGGAWRALAALHMELADYPLHLLHAYRLSPNDIRAIEDATQQTDTVARQRMLDASRRRADMLPYASLVLGEAVALGGFSEAVVSAYGLREGVIIDGLAPRGTSDPLLDGVALSVRLQDPRRDFGEALFDWVRSVVQPRPDLFGESQLDMRLVAAACLMADSGARFHPDMRAKLAYEQALQGAYSNVDHAERAFIALAIGYRYARQFKPGSRSEGLLDKRQIKLARRLGAAMRLGSLYSGRSAAILKQGRLSRGDGQLTLSVSPENSALISSIVERRLQTLANLMELKPIIHIG